MNSNWSTIFLGVIAFATLVAAMAQVAVLIGAARLGRRINAVADRAERAIEPTVSRVEALREQVSDVVTRGAVQVQRAEQLFDDISHQAKRVSTTVRGVAAFPLREGAALIAGARAIVSRLTNGGREAGSNGRREDSMADRGDERPPTVF